MSVDKTFILNLAPEFSSVSDGRIAFAISQATKFINPTVWPSTQIDLAIGYLACHFLKIGNLRGAGAVSSKKVGDISVNNYAPGVGDLAMTGYGAALQALMATLVITPFFNTESLCPTPSTVKLNWPD